MLENLPALLRKLPPEAAHHLAISMLKTPIPRLLFGQKESSEGITFAQLPHLTFPNPIGLAAGFDKNAEAIHGLCQLGFGFLEVGTVTPKAQAGNPKPRIWRINPSGLVNQMGFNNVGLARFRKNIHSAKAIGIPVPIFANIGKGRDTPVEKAVEDYKVSAQALSELVDGLIINISSPNTKNLRDLQTEGFLTELERNLPEKLPAFVKLAPDLSNDQLEKLLTQIKERRFTGVVLTNTSREIAEQNGYLKGGYSGKSMFSRSLECISIAKSVLQDEKLIIGVGGVQGVEQALEMREAGADLLEIYTGFIYKGPKLIHDLATALSKNKG